jgi:hypothetical protein
MIDLENLYKQAAEALTGQKVIVRFRQPEVKSYLGMTQNAGNFYIIDIAPGIGAKRQFEIFCHEIGHISGDHVAVSNDWNYSDPVRCAAPPREVVLEDQADRIGKVLEQAAEREAWRFREKYPVIAKLRALIYLSGL